MSFPTARRSSLGVLGAFLFAALVVPQATLAARDSEWDASLADKAGCGTAKTGEAGVARWLEDCGSVDPKAAPETAARAALATRSAQLGLRADGRDLALSKTAQTAKATYVRFQQTHGGVPVFTGQVVVKYDRAGVVRLINNHTLPNLNLDTTPAVAAADALATAVAVVGAGDLRSPARNELVIYPGAAGPRLAWHVTLPTLAPFADWHVMVSAASGKTIDTWDQIARDNGSGLTYDPNAVQTTGNTSLVDNNDVAGGMLDTARTNLTLTNLNGGGETKLKGSYVDVTAPGVTGCTLPYTPGTASEVTRIYNYTRDDDRFEEVVAYAAINGTQSWFQSLGFSNVNNRSFPIDVHCISDDNSYYSSTDAAVHMGDGGVDDAEDADIIIHEYGHSVHDDQVPGWGPGTNTEQRAMGEGFGDFLAGMYYISKGESTYLANYRYCIGEWDAVSYNPVTGPSDGSGCLRWINGKNQTTGADIGTYPGVPTQEHSDGRFWSAALTCVYEGMGANAQARDDVMKILLESHFSLSPDATPSAFEDAVDALVDADQSHFAGTHYALITDCAQDRGLITSLPAIDVPDPELTIPADGSTHEVDSPLVIQWDSNNAPSTATYDLEYTNDCTPAAVFSDNAESGTNGWTVDHVGGTADWARVTTDSHSTANSWFADNATSVNDQRLVSPNITIPTAGVLTFWHKYDMESGYDGGVVEITTTSGATWIDLGVQMTQNGYDAVIAAGFGSPIAGRSAFTGNSGEWIETTVNLATYAGMTVQIRFRQADDSSQNEAGWWVDDISVAPPVAWTSIDTSDAGVSGYAWMTPAAAGSDYCVRVRGAATGYTTSEWDEAGPFSLVADGPCTVAPFTDVATSHPFCAEIRWMKVNAISIGFIGGTYHPGDSVTRQAMSAILARTGGATLEGCTVAPFNDVPTTHPFCREIKWMKDAGITTGFDGGTLYKPADFVTRQAMSAFLARVAGVANSLPACSSEPFNDVPTSHPFCKEIKWMKDEGISTGFDGGTLYKPADNVTRQAMSAFIFRTAAFIAEQNAS